MDGAGEIDFGDASTLTVPPKLFLEVTDLERKLLKERLDNFNRERNSLRKSLQYAREQSDTLEEQQKVESEGYRQQNEDFGKTKALNERGVVPITRVLDQQRTLLLSRSRYLITAGQSATAKRTLEETRRQTDRFEEARRADLLRELSDVTLNIERINSRLQSTAEKFAVVGSARSTIVSGSDEALITLYRRDGQQIQTIPATDGTDIMPDDIVEITLKQERNCWETSLKRVEP